MHIYVSVLSPPFTLQFALNGNPSHPHCLGVTGLLQAYTAGINSVTLWGPTHFAPVINQTIADARQHVTEGPNAPQKYFVLLILTDGAITDMQATKVASWEGIWVL